jgi:hypothetical protein
MSKKSQIRFYDVAEFFNDDERIMAFAIVKYTKSNKTPDEIWRDLLECNFEAYTASLELIVDTVCHVEFEAFKKGIKSQFKGTFKKGDLGMIQDRGWKLHLPPKVKKPKKRKLKRKKKKAIKPKRRQTTIFDFIGE